MASGLTVKQLLAQRDNPGGGNGSAPPGSTAALLQARDGNSSGSGSASVPLATSPKGGNGDLFGSLKSAAHWAAGKTELAATDLKNIPGGMVGLAEGEAKAVKQTVEHPWVTGKEKQALLHDWGHPTSAPQAKVDKPVAGIIKGLIAPVEHPLRDPFQTLMTVLPLAHGLGRTAEAAGVDAFDTSAPRLLSKNGEETPLQPSKNPAVRGVQSLHDKVVQHAINTKPDSKLAAYGTKRIGNSLDETARYQARLRAVPAQALQTAAKKLNGKLPGHVNTRVEQAALELTSVNTAPEDAAAYHAAQAAKGVEPVRNAAVAKLYSKVAERGLLTKNDAGDMVVAKNHPALAKTDLALAKVQGRGDEILTRYGIRTPEDLQAAINKPGQYRAGAVYEKPTPGKTGVVSQAEMKAQARVNRLQTVFDRATAAKPVSPGEPPLSALKDGVAATPRAERIGGALSVAKDDLQRIQKAAASRVKPTGVIGGETARPGRGFVSYRGEETKASTTSAAKSPGPVVGEVKAPISSHVNTGANIAKGFIPKDVTGMAARHYQQIVRFMNTSERRAEAIRSGSEVKQTNRDVLVRKPGVSHEKISPVVNEILGKSKLTTDDLEGLNGALQDYREQLVPGLKDRFAGDRNTPVGTSAKDAAAALGHEAPEGHVWVDRNILGDLAKPGAGPRGKIARSFDNINSAVTAATVYFKVGHVGTRALTNASTAIIQGSAEPTQIARSVKLWNALGDEDKMRALAAAGQHGFEAMPHEGASAASKVAGMGAKFWARRFDSPFRFNSIAYEARKAGFDTPAKFKTMLDQAEDPAAHGLSAAQTSKVDWVLKRANREGIAYDRLSPFEKQYIARALWFYPWLKGTVGFAANTGLEHPYKAAALGQLGVQGRQQQARDLGALPSYEKGLLKLGGSAGHPLVADFSTFSPFATPATMLDVAAAKSNAADFLNPVYSAAEQLGTHQNSYGQHTNAPLSSALGSLFAPTPEAQIVAALRNSGKNQSRKMFKTTWQSALARALVGPGTPRRLNVPAAHSAASRESSGR